MPFTLRQNVYEEHKLCGQCEQQILTQGLIVNNLVKYIFLKASLKASPSALTSLNPEFGTSAFAIQLELAFLIALGNLP